jgi:hypothetical protein
MAWAMYAIGVEFIQWEDFPGASDARSDLAEKKDYHMM